MTFVTVAWVAASAPPATAHPDVDDATPERDVHGGVTELVVEFTERVEPLPGGVVLLDADGTRVEADVRVEGVILRVRPGAPLRGDYALRWAVRGADSHVVAGTVRGGASGTGSVEASSGSGPWPAAGALARSVAYAAVLVAAGSFVFGLRVLGRADRDRPAVAALTSHGAVVVVAATGVEIAARVGEVAAGGAQGGFGPTAGAALGGAVGTAAALRAGGALALLAAARRPAPGPTPAVAAVAAVAVVVSLPLSGHTAATSPAALVVAGGSVHVAAAAVWAGGVLALAVVLRGRRRRGEAIAPGPLVASFGRLAAVALAAVAVTGVVTAMAILPGPQALVDTAFGRVLLVKVALGLAVVGVALAVRRRARAGGRRRAVGRLVAFEAVLLALVVGATAILVDARTRAASPVAARAIATARATAPTDAAERLPAPEAAALARLAAASVRLPPGIAAHDHGGGHGVHGAVEEAPLSAAEERRLAEEWEAAAEAARRLADPEVARAERYVQASSQVAGVGSHWIKWSLVGLPFDPARPSMLLFDHSRRGEPPRLAGLSYWVASSGAPEGFAGPNDRWHRHFGLCFVRGWHRGEGIADRSACAGEWIDGLDLWMLHAWVVPDRPNRWGRFAPTNPDLCPPWNRVPDLASCSPLDV